jgi:NAD(P)-dependent dehydrogenase (short-subunit alcohol dehydrogenase family)
MDVDDDRSVRAGVVAAIAEYGHLDAVITAAGWSLAGAMEYTTVDEAKAQFETNFFGVVRVVQAVLPQMRAQRHGHLVLISSIGGAIGIPFQSFYSASKFALEGMAEAIAYEVASFGINVTLVQPGNVMSGLTANRCVAESATTDSSYRNAFRRALAKMEHDERHGAASTAVADAVHRVLHSGRPPRRISVGKATERAGLLARRVLPFWLFEMLAKRSLGVD